MSQENSAPAPDDDAGYDYDVLVVGSGFGGSVSALRLTEKGYRVGVLEAGRRWTRESLPKNSWDLKNYLWAPRLGMYGIQRIHLLGNVMVLAGAGVGGGSLNYANTLYVPPKPFFEDPQWGDITNWQEELAPYYDQARRMLGVRLNPTTTPSDVHLKAAAERMGCGDTFHMAPVGVFFGDGEDADGKVKATPGQEVPDPYFGGAGPSRRACSECGECMTGCRHGAKNTLNENYLYLAEKAGAVVHPMTTAVSVTEDSRGGFAVATLPTNDRRKGKGRTFTARRVVLAAGTYGTQTLLHRMRTGGQLPHLSDRLGERTRTNSEALVGAQTDDRRYRKATGEPKADFTRGVAITSSIHPDENTHIEPVRYGKGSNSMGSLSILQVPYAGSDSGAARVLGWLGNVARHPWLTLRSLSNRRWSERTIIGLVMQSLDNSLTTYLKPSGVGRGLLTARQGHGAPNPKQIKAATDGASALAAEINGFAGSNVGELTGMPLTAHFLGGCAIGDSPETGVIDPYHRLYGHPGITVADGSAVSANLGVNPSLTITAQAERAMSFWPNKGEEDPRPAQGEAYRRLTPVEPKAPAVPADAFGALKLPFLGIPAVPPKK
ncbi:GMC oxidoreductase [Streptomyces albogriseolus]|uniref:Cholesterol oxidase n=2 Tax=Streptomyces albogriseolus group TaxID=2867120 RepID=A0ABP6TWR9_9ACTN|nr:MULTISPECIES: GMC family oxidoreductase [Streptomyces]GHC01865.1 cholesterol oxidase [Streptomyces albogriseolus]MCX4568716.1 GMC family oxidoreductase [Streptomyces viridodiastaticus]MCX4621925.1 GMC family oxidoreductase [Streptomyces viridodiastaticus]NIL49534.1 GMC family oxidoreductase [Streptomyces sp. 2BBP-J2]GHG12230.1 cholesterol oxidase [Streptomyces viridodiastaticus]